MSVSRTILTIDDESQLREYLDLLLSQDGHRVLQAQDGARGLEILEKEPVDLILLDSVMPGMNGRDVARHIKSNPRTRGIPLMMLTALATGRDKVQGLEAGADEYITKPVPSDELLARVRAILRMRDIQEDRMRQERADIDARMSYAEDVQKNLLPAQPPQLPGMQFAIRYQPCEKIGGDFYDYQSPGWDRLYLMLGDAEGHGPSAALLMATARAYVRAYRRNGDFSPAQLLAQVNRAICRDTGAGFLMPLVCIFFDASARVIRYANAGHEPPLLFQAGRKQCVDLKSTGPILGMAEDAGIEQAEFPFGPGDVLACFTDGITEGINASQEEFGRTPIESILMSHPSEDAERLADRIQAAWTRHTGGHAADDRTLIVVRC
ncbi:MAG: fused response regulator/phosphatase [Planctomycetes bacterium]|nr:fused response regulator/phosphatase [Planctomycetota bacterium]